MGGRQDGQAAMTDVRAGPTSIRIRAPVRGAGGGVAREKPQYGFLRYITYPYNKIHTEFLHARPLLRPVGPVHTGMT